MCASNHSPHWLYRFSSHLMDDRKIVPYTSQGPWYNILHQHHLAPCHVPCAEVGCLAHHQKLGHKEKRSLEKNGNNKLT